MTDPLLNNIILGVFVLKTKYSFLIHEKNWIRAKNERKCTKRNKAKRKLLGLSQKSKDNCRILCKWGKILVSFC